MRSSVSRSPMPWASAICDERWMTGPSAIGSENGTPTSSTSAPAAATARIVSTERVGSGCPAVRYATSARRFSRARLLNRCVSRSDEVVADIYAVAAGIIGFDDGAPEGAAVDLFGEVGQRAGIEDVAAIITDDAHDR